MAVLIPALDEERTLPPLLRGIPRPPVDEVLVVDNGSADGTADVAREEGARVIREDRRGYGAACLAGLARFEADRRPPDIVVFLDADHGGDPAELHRLVEPIARDGADLVMGARTSGPEAPGRSGLLLHQRLGNRLVLALVRVLFGYRFRDLSPFRAIGWSALRDLRMDDRNFGWTLQMQLRAAGRGYRIREIELPHPGRPAGRSKISGTVAGSARAGLEMIWTVVRERLAAR